MFKPVFKICASITVITASLVLLHIPGTNSFFSASTEIGDNSFSSGFWIPELEMKISPKDPNGDDGWYKTKPCVALTALATDPEKTEIFFRLKDSDNFEKYSGSCVQIPDGVWNLDAFAVYDGNKNWKSKSVSQSFKVDSTKPIVEIKYPCNSKTIKGIVDIKGTVSDANLDGYELEIDDPDGNKIYSESGDDPINNEKIYPWDTKTHPDGNYKIILSAKDKAGNEDQDVNTVKVKNNPDPGDVVINEIMWMGSTGHPGDEWIELRNTTSDPINISGWKIEKAGPGGATITIPCGKSIESKGFFLIANFDDKNSRSNLNVDPDYVVNLSLGDDNNGNLVLKTGAGIIVDTAKGKPWPAGENGCKKKSMERNDDPENGTSADNWHTCSDNGCNDKKYWDDEGNNYGTPGYPNLSGDDNVLEVNPKEGKKEDNEKPEIDNKKPDANINPDLTQTEEKDKKNEKNDPELTGNNPAKLDNQPEIKPEEEKKEKDKPSDNPDADKPKENNNSEDSGGSSDEE
jgi:hypothetical protein